MNNFVLYLILIALLVSTGCKRNRYNIKIIEDKTIDTTLIDMSHKYSNDSLNFRFGLGFNKDYVCIEINNTQQVCDTLVSNQITDFAKSFNFGPSADIKTIGIILNNEYLEIIKPKSDYRFIDIDFSDDTLIVVFSLRRYAVH